MADAADRPGDAGDTGPGGIEAKDRGFSSESRWTQQIKRVMQAALPYPNNPVLPALQRRDIKAPRDEKNEKRPRWSMPNPPVRFFFCGENMRYVVQSPAMSNLDFVLNRTEQERIRLAARLHCLTEAISALSGRAIAAADSVLFRLRLETPLSPSAFAQRALAIVALSHEGNEARLRDRGAMSLQQTAP